MSDSSIDPPTSEKERATKVVQDVMARRRAGEIISDADVLRGHPDLIRSLGELLERASALAFLADEATESPWANLLDQLDENGESLDLSDEDFEIPPELSVADLPVPERPVTGLPATEPPEEASAKEEDPFFSSVPESTLEEPAAELSSENPTENEPLVGRITFCEEEILEPGSVADWPQATMHLSEPILPGKGTASGNTVADSAADSANYLSQSEAAHPGTVRFRPQQRPPMALLKLRDDDLQDSETFRLRQEKTVIGRSQGEITIPHDLQMSGYHATITREQHEGKYRWLLRDQGSRNGLFVRILNVRLKDQDLLLIANRVVRFTQTPAGSCQLQEIYQGKLAESLVLEETREYQIGRDTQICETFLSQEPQLDLLHARLTCDKQKRWGILNCNTLNGIWVRVQEIQLTHRVGFQLGEQRFVFLLP